MGIIAYVSPGRIDRLDIVLLEFVQGFLNLRGW